MVSLCVSSVVSIAVDSRSLLVVLEFLDPFASVVLLVRKRASRSGCITPLAAVRLDGVASPLALVVMRGGVQASRFRFGVFVESTTVTLSSSVTPFCWTRVVSSALSVGLG